jgi:hypothetical protein
MSETYTDHYYYPDEHTKIEVRFIKNGDEIQKSTKTYYLKNYKASVASKIRERLSWNKFGDAINANNKESTKFCDEVFIEVTATGLKKKSDFKIQLPPCIPEGLEINKIYYFTEDENSNKTENKNKITDSEMMIEDPKKEIKKAIVNCRHCGKNTHWSIQCPIILLKKQEEEQKKIENEKEERDKQYREKRKEEDSIIGLKVSELDVNMSDSELRTHFEQFGKIINFYMIKNKKTNKFMGFGYITYSTQQENDNALINITKKPINYVIPSVEMAKPKTNTNNY